MTTRFGIKLSQAAPIDDYLNVWRTADEAGFDHVWVMDHIASLGDSPNEPIFDGWAMQAAMAVATKRVRIGCMVTGNTYRHPGMLAKLATTVDHLSGGRLEFGIGAGWAEREHTMYGLEFGTWPSPPSTRSGTPPPDGGAAPGEREAYLTRLTLPRSCLRAGRTPRRRPRPARTTPAPRAACAPRSGSGTP
ncbi:LLM class flavin-dependent oxidoreductase [Nocardioides sp. NPDC087217]|uniref:LLM class flavin-dependent oxidoreductase n=1 Tax=Nocardioides sp. NPDC087217 TaxID=3364335 RepID=UPI0038222041